MTYVWQQVSILVIYVLDIALNSIIICGNALPSNYIVMNITTTCGNALINACIQYICYRRCTIYGNMDLHVATSNCEIPKPQSHQLAT